MRTKNWTPLNPMVWLLLILLAGQALAQLDDRFGATGVEGSLYLGQKGLSWYRDWNDSYLRKKYPAPDKNKIWTVGKIDYRSDDLGMDYKWLILDLLEDTEVDFLQGFLNLCLALVDTNIIPIIGDYWAANRDLLEDQLEDTLNHFVFTDKKYGIKYRATCKYTTIEFQDTLPKFVMTVLQDTILATTSLSAVWKTHIYIDAWVLNPNPFNWGYVWKRIGDADCEFETTIQLAAYARLEGTGRGRFIQVKKIVTDSRTESDIDWSVFGISFTWEELSNAIEDLVDSEIEKALNKELLKEPITSPYYFVDFFKSLFPGKIVPTQQEVLDRIWEAERSAIERVIKEDGYEGGVWAIGYEPNWFPRLRPAQYAAVFTNYYRLIKQLDPRAKVLGPGLFLTEAIDNPGEVAWQFIPGMFQDFLAAIKDEFQQLVLAYFKMADSKTWYQQFFAHLPPDVKIDINDFHIFPMKANLQAINWDSLTFLMNDVTTFMQSLSQASETWVSEFGNINGKCSEAEVAEMCSRFCQYFKTNTVGISRWFWYLSYGHGPFYDLPIAPTPPTTALLNKKYQLTLIGQAYLKAADNTPPIMDAAPTDGGAVASPGQIVFRWQPAREFDTGIIDYQLQVRGEPGGAIIYNSWVGNVLSHTITYFSGKTLFARVQAKNGAELIGEWSPWSDGITIKAADSLDIRLADTTDRPELSPPDTSDETRSNLQSDDRLATGDATGEIDRGQPNSLEPTPPTAFQLAQNYPNPFNSATTIQYQLPNAMRVMLAIYNAQGQTIVTLVNEFQGAGTYTLNWNGCDANHSAVPSGIYLCRLQAGQFADSRKMILVR